MDFHIVKKKKKRKTSHCPERGLDAHDSGNEDEMFAMLSAISKSKYFTSTVAQKKKKKKKKKIGHHYHRNNLNLISPGLLTQHPSTTTTFLSE